MQAVILAAGLGKRMMPLTESIPKPLVKCNGKPLIEYTLSSLPDEVDEVIIVIGHLGELIQSHLLGNWNGKQIKYVHQDELLGTYHALLMAKEYLKGDFFVLMSDDIYSKQDLEQMNKYKSSILVRRIPEPTPRFGACITDESGKFLKGLIEHPTFDYELANCGAHKLPMQIFQEDIVFAENGEQVLSNMAGNLAGKIDMYIVEATNWYPIANVEDLQKIEDTVKEITLV